MGQLVEADKLHTKLMNDYCQSLFECSKRYCKGKTQKWCIQLYICFLWYMCVHVCVCACEYVCVCVCVCVWCGVRVCVCACVYAWVCFCVRTRVCVHACTFAHVFLHSHVCAGVGGGADKGQYDWPACLF